MRAPTLLRLACMVMMIGMAGCATVHQVTIDAISDRAKPLGASYHLQVEDPTGGVEPALHNLAVAAIKGALGARGLYEAPPGTTPDMIVEAAYGIGHGYVQIVRQHDTAFSGSLLPPVHSKAVVVYDKSLELTGHQPQDAAGRSPGEELWSVKAKVADNKQVLEPYLETLASSCIDYIGVNPGREIVLSLDRDQARVLLQQRPAAPAAAPEPPPQNR